MKLIRIFGTVKTVSDCNSSSLFCNTEREIEKWLERI